MRRRILRDQLGLEPEEQNTGTAKNATRVSRAPRKPGPRNTTAKSGAPQKGRANGRKR